MEIFEGWHKVEFSVAIPIWVITGVVIVGGLLALCSPSFRRAKDLDAAELGFGAFIAAALVVVSYGMFLWMDYNATVHTEQEQIYDWGEEQGLVVTHTDVNNNTIEFIEDSNACSSQYRWLPNGDLALFGAVCSVPLEIAQGDDGD